jgi:hypothetical protein
MACFVLHLSKLITHLRWITLVRAFEDFERLWNIGLGGAFGEVAFCPQGGKFFGNRNVDELVQCNAVRRQVAGFLKA